MAPETSSPSRRLGVRCIAGLALSAGLVSACARGAVEPSVAAPGTPESAKTTMLEAGASALQTDAPADELDIYLVGFHPMKEEPTHQIEAHHFCRQVTEEFAQCALFDGNTAAANLVGIEYIISERLFEGLPQGEGRYWHPHNGEILSGQLVAPGLPRAAEIELMRGKMNSYGKTWHVWSTRSLSAEGDRLPYGEPRLAWSFNRFGEADPRLIETRDARLGMDTEEIRRSRTELIELAHPQAGVDALKGAFPRPTRPIPGVVDKEAAPE